MNKNLLLATILLLALAAVILPGCDEETDAPTGNNLVIGDTNSPEFDFVENWLGGSPLQAAGQSINLTMSLFGLATPPATPPARDRQLLSMGEEDEIIIVEAYSYSFGGGWHIFTFEAIVVDETTSDTVAEASGIDSFQVTLDGDVMQVPDSNFNGINIRAHYNWNSLDADESGVAHHTLSFVETANGLGTVISGSLHDTVQTAALEEAPNCSLELAMDQTLTDFTSVDGAQCPHSGSFSSSVTIDLSCGADAGEYESLDINGTWTIAASVDGDVVHFTFSDGTTTWSATEPCADSPPTSPWAW